jgi:arylsulfatase
LKHFERTPLLPEQLHSAGYRTALIGKWHLDGHPLDRGFDHFFGFLGGFSDHFAGGKGYQLDRAPFTDFGTNYYSTDAFTDRAIQFIQAKPSTNADAPFFLYLSFQAPHNPLQASREDILKYRGKYLGGWQVIREARFKRQKELGIVASDAELPAYPQNLPDWNSLSPEQRDLEDLRMAVFAAMVERMDRGIGRLVEALRQSGQADNTLILFLSDNGADSFSVMDQAMLKQGKLPGDPGSNWQPGTGWAYASVTPWRLYKISQHAGGITTGGIVWSPGQLVKPGRIESSPLHMIDVLPTFLELAGHAGGNSSSAPDAVAAAGESFVPLLKGRPAPRQSPLYFQYMDNRAIRTAEWTLAGVDGAAWELFRATDDPLETRNLAAQKSEVVANLSARWLEWWRTESGEKNYTPKSTRTGPNYKPQGDRGTGVPYRPSAMPQGLKKRSPAP